MANLCRRTGDTFQFLIGRLESPRQHLQAEQCQQFQFLIGRLESETAGGGSQEIPRFQFLIGRLESKLLLMR